MWQQIEMYPMATANSFLFKSTVYKSSRRSKASQSARDSSAAILSQNPKTKIVDQQRLKNNQSFLGLFKMLAYVSTPSETRVFIYSQNKMKPFQM